jgi:uridine phosphorylase
MLNHHRGLWGYSGLAADGDPLTIQSTGLGGPSAAAVVAELVGLGGRRLVRVGTAAAVGSTALGALVVVDAALAADGTSRALGAHERVEADAALADALARACGAAAAVPAPAAATRALEAPARERAAAAERPGVVLAAVRGLVASADIHDPVLAGTWADAGAIAFDLATAAVLAAAGRHGAAAGAILGVTRARGERLADDALDSLEAALGDAAFAAVS